MSVSSSAGSLIDAIQIDFAVDRPALPRKFVVDVPKGYTLDLAAQPRKNVGDGSVLVVGADTPSFSSGFGTFRALDPQTASTDPRAQACAPGQHAAVWTFSTSLAGQLVRVDVYADPGREPGVAYTLQGCASGLAASDTDSTASIRLSINTLVEPTAPGEYRWRVLVTPQSRQAYELQALLSLPQSITLKGHYDQRTKKATLTGRVTQGGKPLARADVEVIGLRGDDTSGFYDTRTNAQGAFTLTAPIAATTDFTASVGATIAPCSALSNAPAGCLGATTVPPDDTFTTIWVSVPGGAVRAVRSADQRRAERAGLTASDFPTGFEQTLGGGDACFNPKHEANLRITGESTSPNFLRYDVGDSPSFAQASGLTRVYATNGQARQAFQQQARASTARCQLKGSGVDDPQVRPLQLPGGRARLRAFRSAVEVEKTLSGKFDFVFLQRGRTVTILRFVFLNASADLERQLVTAVSARMR
jgi:hypothetical protein